MTIIHAVIRAAGLGDVGHILAEYREAIKNLPLEESANLLSRPYDEFKAAVENGLFFVIENAVGNFMAGAGVFDLANPTEKELGMCYVKKSGEASDCKRFFYKSGFAPRRSVKFLRKTGVTARTKTMQR